MSENTPLRALQAAFSQALIDGRHAPDPGLLHERGLPARQRLNVYYHHNQIVQLGALQGIFPAVQRLVGEEFFAQMAMFYTDQYPLRCGDLRTFGAQLPDFMETFEPLAPLPYLPGVARLEWACHESLHAGEATPPTAPDVDSPLRLAAHVRLLHSVYPVAEIWEFALSDHKADSPRFNIDEGGPNHLLIMRPTLDVEVYSLPREEWAWLNGFTSTRGVIPALSAEGEASRCRDWCAKGVLVHGDLSQDL